MILTCSNCSTRFYVDGSSFGAAPRKVRCGNCGYSWVQTPLENEAEAIAGEAPPRKAAEHWDGDAGVRWGALLGWFVFVFVVAALVAGAYQFRDHIVAEWPRAAQIYTMAGIPVQTARAYGLEIMVDENEIRRGQENGVPVLLVGGTVRNTADEAQDVPPVRLMLVGEDGEVLQEKVFEIGANRLEAGAEAAFEARLANPDDRARELKWGFALD